MANMTYLQRIDPTNGATLEGLTIAETIILGMHENTWLIPGVTYTPRNNGGGVDYIKIIEREKNGKATGLGEDGNAGATKTTPVAILVDKKVSAEFDGQFVSAGIADLAFEAQIMEGRTKIMAEDYRLDILEEFLKGQKSIKKLADYDNAKDYLLDIQKEYLQLNNTHPTALIVNLDVYYAIKNYIIDRQTQLGDGHVSTSYKGNIDDMQIFLGEVGMPAEVIALTPQSVHVKRPATVADINASALAGAVPSVADFDGGVQTLHNVNAQAGVINTWVHYYFGKKLRREQDVLVAGYVPVVD